MDMDTDHKRHPLSGCFGDFTQREFQELKDSIEVNGVNEPIVLFESKILDGWHRYRAARELRLPVASVAFSGDLQEAKDFVRAKHTRRNLSDDARALAIARVEGYHSAPRGRPGNSANLAQFSKVQDMAAQAGVSVRKMYRAKQVAGRGVDAVHQAVHKGELKISSAVQIANLPQEQQAAALASHQLTARLRGRSRKTAAPQAPGTMEKEARAPATPAPATAPTGPTQAAYDELRESLAILVEEFEAMEVRVAVHFMQGTEQEKAAAATLIADQQKQLRVAQAEIDALKASRDSYMVECGELRKQCNGYRTVLKKLRQQGAHLPASPYLEPDERTQSVHAP